MRAAVAIALLGLALSQGPALADWREEQPGAATQDPDYVAGKKAIEAKDWKTAITALSSAALRDTRNADIQNFLGFAYRNSGDMDKAFEHYEKSLELNPRHRGAHEYVGEAYLMVGNLEKAEEHLAKLRAICLIPCEEMEDLGEKIEAYKKEKGK